jgi:hypothetical protein
MTYVLFRLQCKFQLSRIYERERHLASAIFVQLHQATVEDQET